MKKNQSGFTLVELVTTVTVVGILAAVAVPRFANLSADARAGVIKNAASAIKQANDTIYARASAPANNVASLPATAVCTAISSGGGCPGIDFPTPAGTSTAVFTHYGFAKDITELAKTMVIDSDLTVSSTAVADFATSFSATGGTLSHNKAEAPATCRVGYRKAANASSGVDYLTDIRDCK